MDTVEPEFEELHLVHVPDFPWDDAQAVMEMLAGADILVPGYVTDAGVYDLEEHLRYAYGVGEELVLLPDRNVTSRLAQIIGGESVDQNAQRLLAAALMAFAQCLNVQIEPSISFHELASQAGNEDALAELARFRASDRAQPALWLDLALGRTSKVERKVSASPPAKAHDLSKPLMRWRRNYILALKIAELELTELTSVERVLAFFQWMDRDFILGGPAALLACLYFSSKFPRKGLFKSLRSHDRERAIAGVKNAAWDLTQVSDFIRRVNEDADRPKAYVLASFDVGLRQLAALALVTGQSNNFEAALAESLSAWWPLHEARQVSLALTTLMKKVAEESAERHGRQRASPATIIDDLIAVGEKALRSIHKETSR